jgi:oxygen-independent coproporphyrinogen III oxidase
LKNISLYLHFPFCAQRCHYCDFFSTTQFDRQGTPFLQGIKNELLWQKERLGEKVTIQTIYFGGGTPNLYSPDALLELIDFIKTHYVLSPQCEISIEMNPEFAPDLDGMKRLRAGGFNRISLGAQSADDDALQFLGRIHSHQRTLKAIDAACRAGFENISLDLIWNIPGQNEKALQKTLEIFIRLKPQHISAYSLSAEPGTPYASRIAKGDIQENSDERGQDQFVKVHNELQKAGYEHYEISNFALSGKRSLHNQTYWQNGDYLGLGPSAHSKMGNRRFWHFPNLTHYLQKAAKNDFAPDGEEIISTEMALEELILLRLRTKEGLLLSDLDPNIREKLLYMAKKMNKESNKTVFEFNEFSLFCTLNGWQILNYLQTELLYGISK